MRVNIYPAGVMLIASNDAENAALESLLQSSDALEKCIYDKSVAVLIRQHK